LGFKLGYKNLILNQLVVLDYVGALVVFCIDNS